MTSLTSLVLLVLISYLGSLLFKKLPSENEFIKSVTFTGNLYILLGFLIGPKVLNLLNSNILNQLNVLYALVLGWAGFLIGLQTNIKSLKRFRKIYYGFSTVNFAIAFILSSAILIFFSIVLSDEFEKLEMVILALAGAVTSPIMLGVVLRDFKSRGKLSHILQFVSGYDNILGVIVLGVIAATIGEQFFPRVFLNGMLFLLISIGIGLFSAALYRYLSPELKKDQEIFLLIIGLLIFISGIAYYLKLSMLFVAFVYGFGLSNFKVNTKKLYINIQNVEKPLYILLLIFVGANITYENGQYTIYLLIFMLTHFLVLLFAGYAANSITRKRLHMRDSIGLANLGMGGLSVAIIMDFHLIHPSSFSRLLIFIVAISIIIYDLISYKFLKFILIKSTTDQEK